MESGASGSVNGGWKYPGCEMACGGENIDLDCTFSFRNDCFLGRRVVPFREYECMLNYLIIFYGTNQAELTGSLPPSMSVSQSLFNLHVGVSPSMAIPLQTDLLVL